MRWPIALIAITWFLLNGSYGLRTQKQLDGWPRVIQLSLHRNSIQDPVAHDRERLAKRNKTVQASLDNLVSKYFKVKFVQSLTDLI